MDVLIPGLNFPSTIIARGQPGGNPVSTPISQEIPIRAASILGIIVKFNLLNHLITQQTAEGEGGASCATEDPRRIRFKLKHSIAAGSCSAFLY